MADTPFIDTLNKLYNDITCLQACIACNICRHDQIIECIIINLCDFLTNEPTPMPSESDAGGDIPTPPPLTETPFPTESDAGGYIPIPPTTMPPPLTEIPEESPEESPEPIHDPFLLPPPDELSPEMIL